VGLDEVFEQQQMPLWQLMSRTATKDGSILLLLERLHSSTRGGRYCCRCWAATGRRAFSEVSGCTWQWSRAMRDGVRTKNRGGICVLAAYEAAREALVVKD